MRRRRVAEASCAVVASGAGPSVPLASEFSRDDPAMRQPFLGAKSDSFGGHAPPKEGGQPRACGSSEATPHARPGGEAAARVVLEGDAGVAVGRRDAAEREPHLLERRSRRMRRVERVVQDLAERDNPPLGDRDAKELLHIAIGPHAEEAKVLEQYMACFRCSIQAELPIPADFGSVGNAAQRNGSIGGCA